ncbi:MAG: TetR family transcriptional regulator [Psychrilyobacter sp.]|uniref:TetR family transcriptional regulator n=1 Tax=Psychrilyobacter sp. TaxID=2586924 RepID=UPI003C70A1C2
MKNIILYNSRELFYEQGYFKTKISDITKKSGISIGNFYRCYNSKENLLSHIIKKELKIYTEDLRIRIPKEGDDILKLKMIMQSIFNFLKKNPFFFALLIELKANDEKLSNISKKDLNSFWDETNLLTIELLKYDEYFDKEKGEFLISMMESQVRLYIRHLFSGNKGKCNSTKLFFSHLEEDMNNISEIVINTFKSLNKNAIKKTIDPSTGAYTNKYFFELLRKTHDNGHSLNLIFLDLKTFYTTKNPQKIFFRDNIMTNIGILLKKYFRSTDSIGRLGPSKFMILILEKEDMHDIFKIEMGKIIEDLQIKFPCISWEDITWKHLYLNLKDDILDKFKELHSIKNNTIIH